MKKTKKAKLSFRRYITGAALAVLVFTVLVCTVTAKRTIAQTGQQTTLQTAMMQFDTIAAELQDEIDSVVKLCAYFSETQRIEEYISVLEEDASTLYAKYQANQEVARILDLAVNQNPSIEAIGILTSEGYYGSDGVWRTQAGQKYMESLRAQSQQEGVLLPRPDQSEGLYCQFTLQDTMGKNICIVVLVDDSFLYQPAEEPLSWVVYGPEGTPFLRDESELAQAEEMWALRCEAAGQNGDSYLFQKALSGSEWTLVYQAPDEVKGGLSARILRGLVAAAVPCFALFVLLSQILGRYVSRPMHKFIQRLRRFKSREQEPETGEEKLKAASVRENIWAFLMVTTVLPTMVFLFVFIADVSQWLHQLQLVAMETTLENKARNIGFVLSDKEQALARVVYDERVLQELIKDSESPGEYNDIQAAVEENVYFSLDDGAVDVYDLAGGLVYSNNLFAQKQSDPDDLAESLGWSVKKNKLNKNRLVLTLRNIDLLSYRTLGYTCLSYDADDILGSTDSLTAGYSQIQVVDEQGEALFPSAGAENSAAASGTPVRAAIQNTHWFLQMEAGGQEDFFQVFFDQNRNFLAVVLLLMIVGEYVLSHLLIRPISAANWALKHFEPGDPEIRLDEESFVDEIGELNRNFNDMANRIDELIDDIVLSHQYAEKMEQQRKNAEITALQMQINPHFLSNTIETISAIVGEGETEKAQKMLVSLNNLFRYGISRTEYLIPVGAEVENSRAYTEIMQVRHTKIDFTWDIDPAVLPCYTIKLLLQPLIENAIYHGLYRVDRAGVVHICVRQVLVQGEEKVRFSVSDNGCGIGPRELETLRQKLNGPSEPGSIGLYNVQARLRLHYGPGCVLDIQSQPGAGTTVSVDIPILPQDPLEQD